ncbi:MAG: metallophosphoesterase, partial [Acidobacteria bacterium]|nr:metallophosphoesterase [Acidobacteriota bacterium]
MAGAAAGGSALADALVAAKPDLLVLAGDAIDRSRTEDWIELFDAVDDLPVVPIPGEGERRGDRS